MVFIDAETVVTDIFGEFEQIEIVVIDAVGFDRIEQA